MMLFHSERTLFSFFIFTMVVLLPSSTSAQDQVAKPDTVYADTNMYPTSKELHSFYVVKVAQEPFSADHISVIQTTYFKTGEIQNVCRARMDFYSSVISGLYKLGPSTSYFQNGQIQSVTNYKYGKKFGPFENYYPNGNLEAIGKYEILERIYFYQHYDSLGRPELKNGTGNFICSENYEVKDSLLLAMYYIDTESKDTIYDYLETPYELAEGLEEFSSRIQRTFIKKKYMRKYRGYILGIDIIVTEHGNIGKIMLLNSINPEIDKAFYDTVKKIDVFIQPRLRNGKGVKSRVYLPIMIL